MVRLRTVALWIVTVQFLVIADQITKRFAEDASSSVLNTGIAFGLFPDANPYIIAVSFVAIAFFAWYLVAQARSPIAIGGILLILSGAVGNLIDRLLIGAVRDFISIGTFPIFNFADAYLTIGVFVLIVDSYLEDRKKKA